MCALAGIEPASDRFATRASERCADRAPVVRRGTARSEQEITGVRSSPGAPF
jgi:hypothetical protein